MKLKALALGSGILVVLAVAAFAVNRWIAAPPTVGRVGQPLMTGVDPTQARKVEIVSSEGTVTLTTDDGTEWRVAEQHGFPVDTKKIKGLFFKLADEKLAHKVTENPQTLPDLGLLTREENGGKLEKDKTGRVLRIYGEGGQPLFALLLGKDRTGQGQMSFGGVYVRYPEDTAAYLVSQSVLTDLRPQDWIDPVVLDVDAGKMLASIAIERSGQRPVRLSREEPDGTWRLAGMPQQQLDQDAVQRVASQLAGMDTFKIESPDVPAAQVGRGKTGRVEFALFDKRRFTVEIGEAQAADEFRYLTIRAELPPDVDDAALRGQVEAFNRRFGGRLLAVYDWDGKRLLASWEDFRKQKEE